MKKINFRLLIIGAVIALAVIFFWFKDKPSSTVDDNSDQAEITATFYPLAYLAEEIGGDLVRVHNITPPGVEPHDFEPSPTDIAKIYNSKLFVLNGGGIDTWAEKIRPNLEAKHIPILEMLFELRDQLPAPGKSDPHLWLDPMIMSREAELLANALMRIDPEHTQEYTNNRDRLTSKLAELDAEYQAGLANCQLREIVATHDAFGYLARRYNFKVLHILGLSPEEEPSPKKVA